MRASDPVAAHGSAPGPSRPGADPRRPAGRCGWPGGCSSATCGAERHGVPRCGIIGSGPPSTSHRNGHSAQHDGRPRPADACAGSRRHQGLGAQRRAPAPGSARRPRPGPSPFDGERAGCVERAAALSPAAATVSCHASRSLRPARSAPRRRDPCRPAGRAAPPLAASSVRLMRRAWRLGEAQPLADLPDRHAAAAGRQACAEVGDRDQHLAALERGGRQRPSERSASSSLKTSSSRTIGRGRVIGAQQVASRPASGPR